MRVWAPEVLTHYARHEKLAFASPLYTTLIQLRSNVSKSGYAALVLSKVSYSTPKLHNQGTNLGPFDYHYAASHMDTQTGTHTHGHTHTYYSI